MTSEIILHNVSIHRNILQNRSINECSKKKNLKSKSPRVFFARYTTYVINKIKKETNDHKDNKIQTYKKIKSNRISLTTFLIHI